MKNYRIITCLLTAMCLLSACTVVPRASGLLPPAQTETPWTMPVTVAPDVDELDDKLHPRFVFDGLVLTVEPLSTDITGNPLSVLRLETLDGTAYEWTGAAAYAWFVDGDSNGTRNFTQPVCTQIIGHDGGNYWFFYYHIVNGMHSETPACLLLRKEEGALILVQDMNILALDVDIARVEAATVDLVADDATQEREVFTYEPTEAEMALPINAQVDTLTARFASLLGEESENNQLQFISTYRVRSDDFGVQDTLFVTPGEDSRPAHALAGWAYEGRMAFCDARDIDNDGCEEILLQISLALGYRNEECHVFTVLSINEDGTFTPAWANAVNKDEAEVFSLLFREADDWFR